MGRNGNGNTGCNIKKGTREMNKPVAIVELGGEVTWLTDVLPYKAKLYTHPVKELTDDFIYKHHMGYVSQSGDFYPPDYRNWKYEGFIPVYKEPCVKELTDEEIIILWNDLVERTILRKAQEQ